MVRNAKFMIVLSIFFFGDTLLFSQQKKKDDPASKDDVQVSAQKKPVYKGKDIPQGPIENPIAKVGPGGVSKLDYEIQLAKFANNSGKRENALTADEKNKSLENAIDDELIFQAALTDGALKDEYTCWRIIEQFKSDNTTAKIEPNSFKEEEIEAFYKANPDIFSTPPQVLVKGIKLTSEKEQKDSAKIFKKAKSNPESLENWIEIGWVKAGDNTAGLPQPITEQLSKFKKGQVTDIIADKYTEWKFIFWITDRKEKELIPFSEARGKVKFEMIGAKQTELNKKLLSEIGKGQKGMTNDELMLAAALKAGTHRSPILKDAILQTYLSNKKVKREKVLPDLKKRFPIQILAKE